MKANSTTREQACALHLWDPYRSYPDNPDARQALAMLEAYRVRGAEARKQPELKAQASERLTTPAKLATARRKLINLIGARGGGRWAPSQVAGVLRRVA